MSTEKFIFQDLPYDFNALEPYIDARTMELHYTKHHRAYYDKFVGAIQGTEMEKNTLEEIFRSISKFPAVVRNNGGGYFNHMLYWDVMKQHGDGEPSGKLLEAIKREFGSFGAFRKLFSDAGANRFGSGWAWLVVDDNHRLVVGSTPNQDNPLMDVSEIKGTPILGLDVWEHAYYLKYQNRRPEYIENWWNIINWEAVNQRYENAFLIPWWLKNDF
jgi:Fe-Mn family superoxide dismutase